MVNNNKKLRRTTMNKIQKDANQIIKEMSKLTLCRDDFIEWILRSTNEDSEFRVYKTDHYISIYIDRYPFVG